MSPTSISHGDPSISLCSLAAKLKDGIPLHFGPSNVTDAVKSCHKILITTGNIVKGLLAQLWREYHVSADRGVRRESQSPLASSENCEIQVFILWGNLLRFGLNLDFLCTVVSNT